MSFYECICVYVRCVRKCMRDPEFFSTCVCACMFAHVCPFVSLLLFSFRSRSLIRFFRLKCLVVFLTTPLSFNFFLPGLCSLFEALVMALSEPFLSHCGALSRVCKLSHQSSRLFCFFHVPAFSYMCTHFTHTRTYKPHGRHLRHAQAHQYTHKNIFTR